MCPPDYYGIEYEINPSIVAAEVATLPQHVVNRRFRTASRSGRRAFRSWSRNRDCPTSCYGQCGADLQASGRALGTFDTLSDREKKPIDAAWLTANSLKCGDYPTASSSRGPAMRILR